MTEMVGYRGDVAAALRAVRRTLKTAGWPMGKSLGRYAPYGKPKETIEGIAVRRIGVSGTVALTWMEKSWTPGLAKAKVAEAVAVLRAKGFPFDERGWMVCEGEPRH